MLTAIYITDLTTKYGIQIVADTAEKNNVTIEQPAPESETVIQKQTTQLDKGHEEVLKNSSELLQNPKSCKQTFSYVSSLILRMIISSDGISLLKCIVLI